MVTPWGGSWRSGRSGGSEGQAPVVDANHILGPPAGWEAIRLVEAGEPVFGIFFADDEERRILLANGEPALYLGCGGPFRFHRYSRTFTLPSSATTS
jgi:hypothetical protein